MHTNRRAFLGQIAGSLALAAAGTEWKKQIGLELYTVRDLLAKDYVGTLTKVAEIGYKEVEPVSYGNMEPKAFRALLDRLGMSAPSTPNGSRSPFAPTASATCAK